MVTHRDSNAFRIAQTVASGILPSRDTSTSMYVVPVALTLAESCRFHDAITREIVEPLAIMWTTATGQYAVSLG